jgi:hypothetical protein
MTQVTLQYYGEKMALPINSVGPIGNHGFGERKILSLLTHFIHPIKPRENIDQNVKARQ